MSSTTKDVGCTLANASTHLWENNMGVPLDYRTTEPVNPDVRARILVEAKEINQERGNDWWAEGLLLYEDAGRLVGSTKLFLIGYGSANDFVEVDGYEDSFMACRDAKFILDQLCRWSLEFGLTWSLDVVDPIGSISDGKYSPEVREFLRASAQMCKSDPEGPMAEDLRNKYPRNTLHAGDRVGGYPREICGNPEAITLW